MNILASIIQRFLAQPPVAIALTGPNGAGKSTLHAVLLEPAGLPFVNADVLARQLGLEGTEAGSQQAAAIAEQARRAMAANQTSFVFETVFSDPVQEKLSFLLELEEQHYTVLLIYIGLSSPQLSMARVATRVLQGGHDVPDDRLESRYGRTLENLGHSITKLKHVIVLDNSITDEPYKLLACFEQGKAIFMAEKLPAWAGQVFKTANIA